MDKHIRVEVIDPVSSSSLGIAVQRLHLKHHPEDSRQILQGSPKIASLPGELAKL